MKEKPITHLIVEASSNDEDYSGECDCCLVEMTAKYVAHLLQYMDKVAEMQQADGSVYNLECWDSNPRFFCWSEKLDELPESYVGQPNLLNADPQFDENDLQRVECQTVRISEDDACWTAGLRHTDISVETDYVSKGTLLRILRSLGGTQSTTPEE